MIKVITTVFGAEELYFTKPSQTFMRPVLPSHQGTAEMQASEAVCLMVDS